MDIYGEFYAFIVQWMAYVPRSVNCRRNLVVVVNGGIPNIISAKNL